MSIEVVSKTIQRIVEEKLARRSLKIVWHAGEPLALGIRAYQEYFAEIDRIVDGSFLFRHVFQTNGTLINQAWCDFFKTHRVNIGISLDGPAFIHDANRRTWSDSPTHSKVMHAVDKLNQNKIPFQVIAVLSKLSLDYPDEIFHFLAGSGCTRFGFNIEEQEGRNISSVGVDESLLLEKYRKFMSRIFDLCFESSRPNLCREINKIAGAVRSSLEPITGKLSEQTEPYGVLAVDHNGGFSSFSPELLTLKHHRYDNFLFGNIFETTLRDALRSEKFIDVSREIEIGVEKCSKECGYFKFCYGVSPSNKLSENGTFESTETSFCRFSKKALTDIVMDKMYLMSQEKMADLENYAST